MVATYEVVSATEACAKPVIHCVIDVTSGKQDCCTPGGRFIIRGRGFGQTDEPSLDIGIYVHGSGSVLQRVFRYASWEDREIQGFWPESISGPVWLFLETTGEKSTVQSTIHCLPILPVSDR